MGATRTERPPVTKRLRIVYVADTVDGGLGGGIVSAGRFVRALRAEHHVTLVASGGPADGKVPMPGFQLPIRAMTEMRFTFARPRRRRLEDAIRGADLVHLQYPFWLSFGAARVARRLGVPVVAAFHVQPENVLYNVGIRWRWLVRWLYRFWVKRLYGRADGVICPSAFAARKLEAYGLTTPTYVVSNGTNPRYTYAPAPRDPAWGDSFVILMVGRLAREKRHDVVFEAIRRSRHAAKIRLVVAGAGPLEPELHRRAADLPIAPRIGFVPDDELQRLLNSADLFVHASDVELEGMAVLEGTSCGLPVVVSDSAESAAQQFALGPEFLFRAGDATSLADRIDHFIDRPAELAAARERYHASAQGYRFEASLEQLLDAYAAVLRSKQPVE